MYSKVKTMVCILKTLIVNSPTRILTKMSTRCNKYGKMSDCKYIFKNNDEKSIVVYLKFILSLIFHSL